MSDNIIQIKISKKIRCPTCKKEAIEPYDPFCSKKCSDIDLIKWLSIENDETNEEFETSSQ